MFACKCNDPVYFYFFFSFNWNTLLDVCTHSFQFIRNQFYFYETNKLSTNNNVWLITIAHKNQTNEQQTNKWICYLNFADDSANIQQSIWTERTVESTPNLLVANQPADGHTPITSFPMKVSHSMSGYVIAQFLQIKYEIIDNFLGYELFVLQYIGCLEIKTSMKVLDFTLRSLVAK